MGILTFLKALRWGWKVLVGVILLFALYKGLGVMAKAHPDVNRLIKADARTIAEQNSLLLVQTSELDSLTSKTLALRRALRTDSTNYHNRQLQSQMVAKKLLNRAVYAERITKETQQENESLRANGSCWEFYGFKNRKSRRLDCSTKERI